MKKYTVLLSLIVLASCKTTTRRKDYETSGNPFMETWDTPFGVPPFNLIKDEHYMPAFEEGMKENLAEIDAIVANEEKPTFENTLEALERTGELLNKVQYVFYNLTSSNTNPKLQELQRELSPLISAHYDKISLNEGLFKRVEALWQNKDNLNLNAEQLKLLEDTRKGFVRSGALLSTEEKEQITKINSEISELTTAFGQNLLAETNGFELVLTKDDLEGLSEGVIAAAAATATQKAENATDEETKAKYKDRYVFTPHRSSMYPFLTESNRRDLREQLYKAYVMRGDNGNENDNKEIAAKISKLRAERAQLWAIPLTRILF